MKGLELNVLWGYVSEPRNGEGGEKNSIGAGGRGAESESPTFTMPKCAILPGPHRPELHITPGDAFMQKTAARHLVGSSLQFLESSDGHLSSSRHHIGGGAKETVTLKTTVGKCKLYKEK